jgi:hypothetical protein
MMRPASEQRAAQPHLNGRMNREVVSSHVSIFATRQKRILGRIFHVEGDDVLPNDSARATSGA